MQVVEFSNPHRFRAAVDPLLLESEAQNNLILGITGALCDRPGLYPRFRLWAVVGEDGAMAAAARTPPNDLILSDARHQDALETLAGEIVRSDPSIPGMSAVEPSGSEFARRWEAHTGAGTRMLMRQGIYEASRVVEPPAPGGGHRRCSLDDLELAVDWVTAFHEEVVPGPVPDDVERSVRKRLEAEPQQGGVWVWERAGEPVALAGYVDPTPTGIRVGPVYTPPDHRGLGYASALVAAMSGWLLTSGRRLCFLYTDLGNPSTNQLYRRIGYRKVGEAGLYEFAPGTVSPGGSSTPARG